MHHRTFLFTACLLGGASLAAAKSYTSASTPIAADAATTPSTIPNFSFEQISKPWREIYEFQNSHTKDPEYSAFRKFTDEQHFSKGTDDTEDEFKNGWKNDMDFDVDVPVTLFPSSLRSYVKSIYVQQASLVDSIRAGMASEMTMPTMTMATDKTMTGTGTGIDSSIKSTNSQTLLHTTMASAIETRSLHSTKKLSNAMTTPTPNATIAPSTLRRSSSVAAAAAAASPLSSLSTTSTTDTGNSTIDPSSSKSSTTLHNAATARQAMMGSLGKAAGAFAFAVAGLVFLL